LPLVEGRASIATVAVTNRTARTWAPDDDPPTVVGGRVLDDRGALVGGELRGSLTGPVPPGHEALVRLAVPGDHLDRARRLEVGLLQEGVAWYDAKASVGLERRAARRILVSSGVSTFAHLGDDLILREVLGAIARDLPDVVPVLLAHPTHGLAERFGCEVVPSPAALPVPEAGRIAEPGRRSRDLVSQARRAAKGDEPTDPAVAAALAPFRTADALVIAPGGGLASQYTDTALLPTAVEAAIAKAFDVPVFVEGPSIGPLESRREQAGVAQIIEGAARVTVRDPSSADVARRIGKVVRPEVVADPATAALRPLAGEADVVRRWLESRGIPPERRYAVFSLRAGRDRPDHLAALRAAIESLPEGTGSVYLPHCRGEVEDRSLVDADEWARSSMSVWDLDDDHAAAALVAGSAITVGSRFHLTVLAAAAGVPSVAMVADEYDRRRLRRHKGLPGVRIVERRDAPAVAVAVRELLDADPPEPLPWWDSAPFTAALSAVLPAPPKAP
jgi:polysaccharide pyruvyl transferase WcaK-like protein